MRTCQIIFAAVLALSLPGLAGAADGAAIKAQVAAAAAGTTVKIPAGSFSVDGLVLPAGVGLAGAGYDQTTLVVTGAVGIASAGTRNVVISDLTVRGAADAGISLEDAHDVTIRRVRLLRSLCGVAAKGSSGVRIENAVLAGNRTGARLVDCAGSAIVGSTFSGNWADGIALTRTSGCAVFNDLIDQSPIGVVLTGNQGLALDHNGYSKCDYVGKGTDVPMPTVYTWRDYTGNDRHSTMLPVAFADAAKDDFRPVTTLAWAHDRSTVDGWGVPALGAVKAPDKDIAGAAYRFGPCLGAFEPGVTPDRAADGEFAVAGGDGDTSVGLYRKDGTNVAFLVDMLPLAKGSYKFWLPSRDWRFAPVAAGDYELRVVESKLSLKWVGSVANAVSKPERERFGNDHTVAVLYDAKDRPIVGLPWSEAYVNFRGMDERFDAQRWAVPGCKDYNGMASDGAGALWGLNMADKDHLLLRRIDVETGIVAEIAPGQYSLFIPNAAFKTPHGMAELGGNLYLADHAANKLWITPSAKPTFAAGVDIPSPTCPSADRKHSLVWVISGRAEVLGLDGAGAIKHRFKPGVGGLVGLSINGDRMALVSLVSGKVHLFDCADPEQIKPLHTIGTGDGPYGDMRPDRFLFQRADANAEGVMAGVGLDSAGRTAVIDRLGVKLFDPKGAFVREFSGVWAQYCETGPQLPSGERLILEKTYPLTIRLDAKAGTWKMDQWLSMPAHLLKAQYDALLVADGKLFVCAREKGRLHYVRFDKGIGSDVVVYKRGAQGVMRFSGDLAGIDDEAKWTAVAGADGKPIAVNAEFMARMSPTADGSLDLAGAYIPFAGLDEQGAPRFDWAKTKAVVSYVDKTATTTDGKEVEKTVTTFTSPYNGTTPIDLRQIPVTYGDYFSDGTRVDNVLLNTQPLLAAGAAPANGTGFSNHAGSDLIGVAPSGKVRWFRPMSKVADPQGGRAVDDLVYLTSVPTQELQIIDKDGFQVGCCNVPGEVFWGGMWLDNPWQFNVFKGPDGRHNCLYGDFNDASIWWMQVDGVDTIARSAKPFAIDAAKAAALAGLPPPAPPEKKPHCETRLTITKLAAPMPIDGSPDKWRAAVPVPQCIITPEACGNSFKGAKDCCAFVRLAYFDKDLYVQAIRFDDIITDHQLSSSFYLQDCVEMSLNSFVAGVKINCSRVSDAGDLLFRDGWFIPGFALTPEKAPRKITVVPAKDLADRALMERVTGEDLSGCKAQVMEFRVTLDQALFEKRDAKVLPDVSSGKTMRIGFLIDDNDSPGADIQRCISWPATYGTFASPECSALATFQ